MGDQKNTKNYRTMNDGALNQDQQDQLLFMMLIQQHQQIGMMGLGKLKIRLLIQLKKIWPLLNMR